MARIYDAHVVPRFPPLVWLASCALVAVAACSGTTNADIVDSQAPTSVAGATTVPETDPTAGPAELPPEPGHLGSRQPVTLAFGGDVHFDGSLATTVTEAPDSILAGVAPVLHAADLAVVNLETAITDRGDPAPKAFNSRAPADALSALAAGGVDVVTMANEHGLDYGGIGLSDSLAAGAASGVNIIGLGNNEDEAYSPFVTEIAGQRIAVIGATQVIDASLIPTWTALDDQPGLASAKREERLVAAVTAARLQADTLVVYLHWGTEKEYCPNEDQLDLVPKLVEAGADIIVGSHAHRIQGGGYFNDAYVHYGLGNLVYKSGSAPSRETGLLTITVTGRRIDEARWTPASVGADHLPSLSEGATAESALGRFESRRECGGLAETPAYLAAATPTTTIAGG